MNFCETAEMADNDGKDNQCYGEFFASLTQTLLQIARFQHNPCDFPHWFS